MAISVVVADPEKERRAACLRRLSPEAGIRVIAEASTPAEALELFRRRSPGTRIIVLTGQTSRAALLDAIAHGAYGCLNRRQIRAFLPKAVRKVDQGEPWVSRKMVPSIIDSLMRLPVPNGTLATS
jgi:DNA-binding NarL/FixJ family response regulator